MSSKKREEKAKVGTPLPTSEQEVGRRLRQVISVLGGGESAGKVAGVSENMVSRYLQGHSKPSFQTLAMLARAAGVSLDWIAGTSNEKLIPDENMNLAERADRAARDAGLYGATELHRQITRAIEPAAKAARAHEKVSAAIRGQKKVEPAARAYQKAEKLARGYGSQRPGHMEENEPAEHSEAMASVLDGFVFVPKLEVEASAGFGREAVPVHQVGETVAFQESWLHRIGLLPDKAHVLTAIGDSMEPTIRDGDLLLVDTSIERVRDNGIYVVVVSGMVFVKRLHVRMDGSLVLKSDNPMYPEETIPADDTADLHVAGRVRWFGRTI